MDYLQYYVKIKFWKLGKNRFKPYYKWITFNTKNYEMMANGYLEF